LRLAAQRGALENKPALSTVLEYGPGEPAPLNILEGLIEAPTIRLISGPVLEFSRSEELKRLRQSPMRRELDQLLSPRHVSLNLWRGQQILERLQRQDLFFVKDISTVHAEEARGIPLPKAEAAYGHLTKSERSFLLSLVLLAQGLKKGVALPPGLLAKLAAGLDGKLRAAAARKAEYLIRWIEPLPPFRTEETHPLKPSQELIKDLQEAIDREESIDVLYQASTRYTAEPHHLTSFFALIFALLACQSLSASYT
jgi:hypothetical protein